MHRDIRVGSRRGNIMTHPFPAAYHLESNLSSPFNGIVEFGFLDFGIRSILYIPHRLCRFPMSKQLVANRTEFGAHSTQHESDSWLPSSLLTYTGLLL